MITYGIFNPGAGLFISGILFCNDEDGKTIISLIGVLFGILLMFCPYILAAGLYLLKVLNNILNLYLIKMFFIYFGTLWTIFSWVFSFLQKDLDEGNKNQFNIHCEIDKCYELELKSNFGSESILRIICNIFIPGSGIFSLLKKYGCHTGIVFIGIFQTIDGLFLYIIALSLILNIKKYDEADYIFVFVILIFFISNYIPGTLIIFISDYCENRPKEYDGFAIFPLTILNILGGGFGDLITIDNTNNCFCKDTCGNCTAIFFKILFSIIGIFNRFLVLFAIFTDAEKSLIIISLVLYSVYIILSIIFHFVEKRKIEIRWFWIISNYLF